MKIKEIMTKEVEVLHPNDTIQAAAQKMREQNVGFLPVLENDELIGVITDRDLVVRVLADGVKSKAMIGHDILTSPGIYCFDDQQVEQATQLMRDYQVRRLVVLDHDNGSVAGIVSLGDLAANLPSNTSGEVLQEISSGFVKAH